LTPEEVAEKANPGWKAVPVAPADAEKRAPADAVAVDTEKFLAKHGRAKSPSRSTAKPARSGAAVIVQLEPEAPADRRGPRRSSVVQDGKEIGQGG
jgi:hypothetical protein